MKARIHMRKRKKNNNITTAFTIVGSSIALSAVMFAVAPVASTSVNDLVLAYAFAEPVADHLYNNDEQKMLSETSPQEAVIEESHAQTESSVDENEQEAEAALAVEEEAERQRVEKEAAEKEAAEKERENKKKEQEKKEALQKKEKIIQLSLTETEQGSMEENAKKVYSVMATIGIPDMNIAGILGNWETESGIDPTILEGIYSEPYYIGKKKIAAMADPAGQAEKCFAAYDKMGLKINKKAYYRSNGELWPGIGIGGFTGPAIDPLMTWAGNLDKPWYSLEVQISYAVNGFARGAWLKQWTKEEESPSASARAFLNHWEGCYAGYGKRGTRADKWYKKIQNWKPDLEYGQKVLDMMGK